MFKTVTCISFMLALILPATASATLIEADFLSSGDNLLTQHTESGLEWLDITYTKGAGRNVIENGYKDLLTLHGFRYAKQSEVANLFVSAGIQDLSNGFTSSNLDAAQFTQSLLGVTHSFGYGDFDWADGPSLSGIVDFDIYQGPFESAVATIQILDSLPIARATVEDYTVRDNVSHSWVGSFLVRDITTIPSPHTIFLILNGLFGLLIFRKLNSKKQ